ncbi:MAG: response regulator [Sandaracinaceae bacterium]|nr:response regulator [Sandaracinaceae bacterium]
MISKGLTERLLLVDDDDLVRAAYRRVLAATHEVMESATVTRAKELVEAYELSRAVLDYRLPDGDGLELLAWMRARGISCPVLVVTGEPDTTLTARAFLLGAQLVFKPAPVEVLVAFGKAPHEAQVRVDVTLGDIVRSYASEHGLSARQTELLVELLNGTPRGALGPRLGVGDNTIKTMVREILGKTQQPSTKRLVSELLERAAEARERSRR